MWTPCRSSEEERLPGWSVTGDPLPHIQALRAPGYEAKVTLGSFLASQPLPCPLLRLALHILSSCILLSLGLSLLHLLGILCLFPLRLVHLFFFPILPVPSWRSPVSPKFPLLYFSSWSFFWLLTKTSLCFLCHYHLLCYCFCLFYSLSYTHPPPVWHYLTSYQFSTWLISHVIFHSLNSTLTAGFNICFVLCPGSIY